MFYNSIVLVVNIFDHDYLRFPRGMNPTALVCYVFDHYYLRFDRGMVHVVVGITI